MADPAVQRAGKRAFFMSEQLAFHQFGRDRRTVHFDHVTVFAIGKIVYRLCDQSLAGTGFTLQQDGGVAGCDNVDLLQDGLDGDAVTDDGMGMVVILPANKAFIGGDRYFFR